MDDVIEVFKRATSLVSPKIWKNGANGAKSTVGKSLKMERRIGLEPMTSRLRIGCSTNWATSAWVDSKRQKKKA